jgi:predicted phage-related endonuclease
VVEVFDIPDRETWLRWRTADLTASDVGAAAGVDRHKSALALYAEKTGMLLPQVDNPMMRRGRWFEPAVMAALADERPDWAVRPVGKYYRDAEQRLAATPDYMAVTDEPGLTNIQAKVVSSPVFARDWTEGPPLAYQLQTLTEGLLMDAQRSYVAALVVSTFTAELHLFRVDRHKAAEDKVREIAKTFWQHVDQGRPPPVDATNIGERELIADMYPESKREAVVDLTGDNMLAVLLHELLGLKRHMSVARKRADEIETEIKAKIGEAERAIFPGFDLSWKSQKRKAYTVPEKTYRVLRVVGLDDEEEEAA